MQNQNELDRLAEELTLCREMDELGTIRYFNEKDELHRVHGPAIIYPSCGEIWFRNGKRHRIDGPAVIFPDATAIWYIAGIVYAEEDFNKQPDVIAYAKSKRT